jgi:hypothetical protein
VIALQILAALILTIAIMAALAYAIARGAEAVAIVRGRR